jgi:tetratricopeptide (TPR) repeat protein
MTGALVAALLAAGLTPSAGSGERFATARLQNGASIGFALLRSGGSGPSVAIGEAALPRTNSVSRVLWDRASGAYFGYRVEVERPEGPVPFRVSFKALDRGAVERALKQRGDCSDCPPPAPLGIGLHFPPPQSIGEGEALTLELLTNPDTGERIFDVVKLSAGPVTAEALHAASERAREGQEAVRRAETLGARGRYAEAAEDYKKALAVQPLDSGVHNKLGICYQYLQNETLAQHEYERALEIRPSYAEAWNNLGTLEQSNRRFKQAVRAYKKAIAIKPTFATAWKNIGHAYVALGQVQDAFEAYREAFRLDPAVLESQAIGIPATDVDVATQNYYLAKLLAINGQNDKAIELLRRAREAGFRDFARVQSDPDFQGVVRDPRFREIAQQN